MAHFLPFFALFHLSLTYFLGGVALNTLYLQKKEESSHILGVPKKYRYLINNRTKVFVPGVPKQRLHVCSKIPRKLIN